MNEQVFEALREVIDPELRINVVDLGLIYSTEIREGRVEVAMTLTTPGCPLSRVIMEQAEAAIWRRVPNVQSVQVRLVWSPPWSPAMMSDAAKDEVGWD